MGEENDRRYSVAVVATMSAGKSTLLNAMMCTDLLPSRNEACTATVFKIEDDDEARRHFSGRYKVKDDWSDWYDRNINKKLLEEWNKNAPQEIEISGDLPNITNTPAKVRVCFIDTPGPNNAMCEKHAQITKQVIADNNFSTLCFVINCSVAGVKDEWQLLFELKKQLFNAELSSHSQVIFVLNKIDLLDIEKGEKIIEAVNMCRQYLEKDIGFKNPIVIPICSKLALGIRTAIRTAKRLTKLQHYRLLGRKPPKKKKTSSSKKTYRMSRSYICRLPQRQQMELSFLLEGFNKFSHEYRDALRTCALVAEIMPDYEARKLPKPTRKIYIHDRFYTYKELFAIETLAGVGYLEKIIEKHCHEVIPEIDENDTELSRDAPSLIANNDIDADNNTDENNYISDEEFNNQKDISPKIAFSQEEILKLPKSINTKNKYSLFKTFEYATKPGKEVLIACSANGWKSIPMIDENNSGVYKANMLLPTGIHYYKLHTNGTWFYLSNEEFVHDNMGDFVNIIEVKQQSKESSEMLQVNIKYNPYLVTTEISLDNVPVQENSKLAVLTQDRLQNWIDKFFPALYDETRQKNIQIHFEGTKLDFNDLADAVEDFLKINPDFNISISQNTTEQTDEGRLNKLRDLFEEGKKGPFAEIFNSDDMERAFARATDPTFEVNVIATMSSGKSTVVNALLGKELMPAKNEACTATITKIKDVEGMPEFMAQRFDNTHNPLSEPVVATNEILTEWNDDPNTHLIEVKGNIPTVTQTNACTYVFVDTPGPNNARTAAHEQTTLEAIQSKPLSMVLYILNAQQLSTKDDDSLLRIVCREMYRGGRKALDRFVFIANKIDVFDPEKKESVTTALENVRQYLKSHGIANPLIIPASALLAKLLRMEQQGEKLTRNERADLFKCVELFTQEREMNMLEHAKRRLSKDCTRRLEAKLSKAQKADDSEKKIAEILSGIPIVEELLNDFLQKHALPAKLKDAVDTFSRVMQASVIAGALNEQLAKSEEELENTVKAIQKFNNDSKNLDKAKNFREKVRNLEYKLSKEADDTCSALAVTSEKLIEDMDNTFSEGKALPEEARHMIENAVHRCQSLEAEVNVTLNEALKNEYFAVIENLRDEYQKYVADIINENFPENDSLRMLQMASLELPSITEMVMDYTQTEQVKTGTKKVKIGTEQVKTGTRKVKIGSEQVKVGEKEYVESYRTERYGFLWLNKREVPIYAWRDVFETRDIYDTQDVYEVRAIYEDRDVIEERKIVNLAPILRNIAKTIRKFTRENVTRFEENAEQSVIQAINTLLHQMDVIDERVKNISKQLESASSSKQEKERIVAENRKKVEWYSAFRKKVENVLAI